MYGLIFAIVQVLYIFTDSLILPILITAVVLFNSWLIFTFGDCNLDKLIFTGPFKVGYKEFRTKVYGNEISVFYPIDEVEYQRKKD